MQDSKQQRIAQASAEHALIREQLERVLGSPVFRRAERLSQFLRYIVERQIAGEGSSLKETVIGTEVYGRPAGYDPKADPIVRTEARRLRNKLEEYRSAHGQNDQVAITVPTGGYSPAFEFRPVVIEMPKPRPVGAPSRRRSIRLPLVGSGVLLAALVVLVVKLTPGRTIAPQVTHLTTYLGSEFQPALAPDLERLAFIGNGGGEKFDLYVKQLGVETPVRITDTPAHELNPVWSPDGREIAFLRLYPDNTIELIAVPWNGGVERIVHRLSPAQVSWEPDLSVMRRVPGLAWSPDGNHLATSSRCDTGEGSQDCLYLISRNGLERKKLTAPPAGAVGDSLPAFSPDGRQIAFVRTLSTRGITEIFILRLADGGLRQLTSDQRTISAVSWTTGDRIFFLSNRTGGNVLWSVAAQGGVPEEIAAAGRSLSSMSASADGTRVVYSESFRNSNVWRKDLMNGTDEVLVISSSRRNDSASYSADGQRIVFVSNRSGSPQIWIAEGAGSNPRQLTNLPPATPVGTPRWSPDGRTLAFDSAKDGHSIIMTMSAAGGASTVFAEEPGDNMMPAWSRDGRYIYYLRRENGPPAVYRKPAQGGAAALVTREAQSDVLESPDGAYIYFARADGIWKAPAGGGDAEPVPNLNGVVHGRYFAMTQRGIYFVAAARARPAEVDFFDFATGARRRAATIAKPVLFGTPSLSVSSDDRWLLYSQLDNSGMDLMMLEFR